MAQSFFSHDGDVQSNHTPRRQKRNGAARLAIAYRRDDVRWLRRRERTMVALIGNALLGAGILVVVVMGWVGVQHLFRKSEGLPPDCDVLGDTGRGCAHCTQRDACDHVRGQKE